VDSPDEIAQALMLKRRELGVEQQAVADTLALLARIEEQRRANPDDEARWDKRSQYLQDVLQGSRERIAALQQSMLKMETGLRDGVTAEPAPAAVSRNADASLVEQRRLAADRVMGAPVFKLESLPLEDYALARSFLAAPESLAWPRDRREELRRRIAIYDRRAERERLQSRPRMTIDERRHQLLLRNVLDKCRAQAHASLTLGEIDLLIHSCDLLAQNRASFEQDDRLFDLVNRAVDEVCQRWAKLEAIKDALKPDS